MSDPEVSASTLDTRLVRELADILTETGLTEIEIERGDLKIRVAKQAAAAATQVYAAAPLPTGPTAQASTASAVAGSASTVETRGDVVKSPMVGTVYLQAQPGSPPFAKVGDKIAEGQTLLLVEAMKTMNPIVAPRAGVLIELLVGDAQPVEYGEPLAIIG